MVRAGLDFLWMQISQICSSSSVRPVDWICCGCRFLEVFIHPSLGRWIGFSVDTFCMVRPLDWISVDADFRVLIIHV